MQIRHPSFFSLMLIAIFAVLVIAVVLQVFSQEFRFPDSLTYLQAAKALYFEGKPDAFRPVLFSLINGIPLLFGSSDDSVFGWSILVNLGCWLGTVLLLFRISSRYVSASQAFWISVVFLLCPGSLILIFHLLTESVFTFMLMLALYGFVRFRETHKFVFAAFSVVSMVLSVLVKPGAMLLGVLATVYFLPSWIRNFRSFASLSIVVSWLCIGLYMLSMKLEFGNFTVSYIDSFTFYNYIGARARSLQFNEPFKQGEGVRYREFASFSPSEQKRAATLEAIHQLKENPQNLIKAYFINISENAIGGSSAIDVCQNKKDRLFFEPIQFALKAFAKLQNIFFSIAGIALSVWVLFRRREHLPASASAIAILLTLMQSGISSSQGDRFTVVLYPLVLVLVSIFIAKKPSR